jgi:16S rRNA (adenine(1408)-N(1))-methyltransferase
MLLNTGIYRKPVPKEVRDLPKLTLDYVDCVMAPAYARVGLTIVERRALGKSQMRQVETTWGRRLAYGRDPTTFYVRAQAETLESGCGKLPQQSGRLRLGT